MTFLNLPLPTPNHVDRPLSCSTSTGSIKPEPPPSDPVAYSVMEHHYVLFHETRIVAVLLSGGARSTAELSLSLGAGLNLEACSTTELGLSRGYSLYSGRARSTADLSLPLCYGIFDWKVMASLIGRLTRPQYSVYFLVLDGIFGSW